MRNQGSRIYWTEERILEVAQKYEYLIDFQKNQNAAYNRARKSGILAKLNLKKKKHDKGYWTDEMIMGKSKMYKTKIEFSKGAPFVYKLAGERKLLGKMSWLKCEQETNPVYLVYAYVDEKEKAAYIGLTKRNLAERDKEHRHAINGKKDSVLRYFESIGIEIPSPIILKENLYAEEAQDEERKMSVKYYKEGYHVINKISMTGKGKSSLGSPLYWTYEKVIEESHKYKSRSEFKRNAGGAYNIAKGFGLLETFTWLETPKRKESLWPKDVVFALARKYKNRYEFRKNELHAYNKAQKTGWLDEMTFLDTTTPHIIKKWTKEAVFAESKKYKSRIEFKKGNGSAYQKACENKWIEEMSWLVSTRKENGYWTKEKVFEISKKYESRSTFAINEHTAYNKAYENHWLNEMTWFKPTRINSEYWTKEKVIEERNKFRNVTEFAHHFDAAYRKAKKNGWL